MAYPKVRPLLLGVTAALLLAAGRVLAIPDPAPFQYTIIDLGSLGASPIVPQDINAAGQVVGYSSTPSGDRNAFVYSNGTLTNLGTLGQQQSWAWGINDNGVIVGSAGGSWVNTTFTYANGTFTTLPTTINDVAGINNNGLIAATTYSSLSGYHAAIFDGTTVTNIDQGAYSSRSYDINLSGQVIGAITPTSGSANQGFLYSNGSLTLLGTLGGSATWVYGMNNSGQVVGTSQNASGGWDGFLYSGGTAIDFGSGLVGRDINNNGQIVGGLGDTGGGAFIFSGDSVTMLTNVTNLSGTNFVTLNEADAINDSGLIAGFGTTSSGAKHAFLLAPITPAPEPGTWATVAAVMLAVLVGARSVARRRARSAGESL